MPRGLKMAMTDSLLIWIVAGGVVVIGLVFVWFQSDTQQPPQKLTVQATLEPHWPGQQQVSTLPKKGDELVIYLDVSHPMGGFLPPSFSDSELPGLATVTHLLPGYLVQEYGGPTHWKTVANEIHSLPRTPHFDRALFRGSETFLEPAIEEILAGLNNGRLAAAMLVTDLVATSGPESAMGLVRPLADWLGSPAVRAGQFDAGILGVRTTFWGVQASTCSSMGDLGCWYSEQANRYFPLLEAVKRPFYVLILGRTDDDPERVDRLGRQLQKELRALDAETLWERFLERRGTKPASLDCSLYSQKYGDRQPQFVIVQNESGVWDCQQNSTVQLDCQLVLQEDSSELPLVQGETTWPWLDSQIKEGRFHVNVDCSHWKAQPPKNNLRFKNLYAGARQTPRVDWSSWTAFSDQRAEDLRGTLQLALFLEKLRMRPQRYEVRMTEPIMKVENNGQ